MAHVTDCTVVSVFEDANEARAAAAELKSAGFDSGHIYVSSEPSEQATLAVDEAVSPTGNEHGIKEWFKSLFGMEEHAHRARYEAAIAGGKTVVSVDSSESNYRRASEILESHSPVNIHTDDYGTGRGVATPNVYNAGYQGSRSDILNAEEELNTPADQPGSTGHPVGRVAEDAQEASVQGGAVRIYPQIRDKPVEEHADLSGERGRASKASGD
jgi:hypothetical protein